MNDRVVIEVKDGVAEVVLARPDKKNALDPAMFKAIVDAGESLKGRKPHPPTGEMPHRDLAPGHGPFRSLLQRLRVDVVLNPARSCLPMRLPPPHPGV